MGDAMKKRVKPDLELVREVVRLDELTGCLYWLPRRADHFRQSHQSTDAYAASWNRKYAGRPALNYITPKGYRRGTLLGLQGFPAHQVVWALFHGGWPKGEIDHINGIRSDNRPQNLRDVAKSTNQKNAQVRLDNKSGTVGVSWNKRTNRWHAYISSDGQPIHLGYFESLAEATAARKSAERLYQFHKNHGRKRQS
ncbi:HNH endonuclease signature motif containing protein [Acidiphilium sp.]|uniref:HNH endonuclease signature motif containing protein n=1 Tax=Acidiphilium sp. TaxID=527 RepID=UPI00258A70E8|nr:HNH endonuclease signature motif containing protein [Acidiphilium sp.]